MEPNQNPTPKPTLDPLSPPETQADTKSERKIEFTETTIMAAISYLSILVFIPLLTKRNNVYIMYHVKQGLVLFALWIIVNVISMFVWALNDILNFVILVFAIIGIIHALRSEERPLPLIGHLANKIKL